MTQEPEPGPITVQLAACEICDALFMASGRRESSPCHGADPVAILATLAIYDDGTVQGTWGSSFLNTDRPLPEAPAAVSQPPDAGSGDLQVATQEIPAAVSQPPLPDEEEEDEDEGEEEKAPVVLSPTDLVVDYLANYAVPAEHVRQVLIDAGAHPDDAGAAVGRLEAVRSLLQQITPVPEDISWPGA